MDCECNGGARPVTAHSGFRGHNIGDISIDGHSWGTLADDSYEQSCQACEIHVLIDTHEKRNLILGEGGLRWTRTTSRSLSNDIEELGLKAGDRLEPGPGLRNIGNFETQEIGEHGFDVVFWRATKDDQGRINDRAHHRCPLFGAALGITPQSAMQIDTLHTLYLGALQKYVQAVCWNAIDSDVFHVGGPKSACIELTTSYIENDMKEWYKTCNIPVMNRVNHLKPSMLGNDLRRDLKLKAAETGTLVPWAVDFSRRHRATLSRGGALKVAGEALVAYMDLLRAAPKDVPLRTCQELLDLCLRHLSLCELAGIHLVPKHHMWVHLTLRLRWFGNARLHACFLDESLNLTVANCAAASHRSQWERGIFARIRLLPRVKPHSAFAAL